MVKKLKCWRILKKNKNLTWFQNKKDKSKIVEISIGTLQTGDKFRPYERVWKLYIPNRLGGQPFKSKTKVENVAKSYMKKHNVC